MLQRITHPLPPIYNKQSQVLILGTMPSVKSREVHFYYGHPKNRFWNVLEAVFQEKIIDKEAFLLKHHIALWDVCASCEIDGSSDHSIKQVIPNDISKLIKDSNIKVIFTTGKVAYKLYLKYFKDTILLPVYNLPSTSPANCAKSLEDLKLEYQKIKEYIDF